MLGTMARIAHPQPNEAMARIAPRFLVPQPNGKQQNLAGGSAIPEKGNTRPPVTTTEPHNFSFSPAAFSAGCSL
jgi:hypothetical protein